MLCLQLGLNSLLLKIVQYSDIEGEGQLNECIRNTIRFLLSFIHSPARLLATGYQSSSIPE